MYVCPGALAGRWFVCSEKARMLFAGCAQAHLASNIAAFVVRIEAQDVFETSCGEIAPPRVEIYRNNFVLDFGDMC